ncbi:hypothetical protein JHK84_045003 [Glycine max]|nr:hypothetical protein JHK86_044893 [Glycine max]KAG5108096.1 hypothetical protein JHK84_045003 [Glycine max]
MRERDRERAQARAGGKTKQPKNDGLTPEQRRERDAKALQEKTAKKAAQAAGGNNAACCDDLFDFIVSEGTDLNRPSLISINIQILDPNIKASPG